MEKENVQSSECSVKSKRLFQRKKNVAQGNDFVFKNYQLQQNHLFQQKKNQQNLLQFKKQKSNLSRNEYLSEQDQDDFVIISLNQLPKPEEIEVNEKIQTYQGQINEQFNEIFIFDEDQDIPQQKSIQQGQSLRSNLAKRKSQISNQLVEPIEKSSARDQQSYDELMTPKSFFDPYRLVQQNRKQINQDRQAEDQGQNESVIQQLQGIQIDKSTTSTNLSFNIIDKQKFVMHNLPSGIILKCIIKRTNSILNILSPEFDLYLANGLKHIISAKKYPFRNRQLFKFSTDPLNFNSSSHIATMHANVNHNLFWLLDKPKKIENVFLSFVYLVIGYQKISAQTASRKFGILLPPSINSKYQYGIDYDLNCINYNQIKEDINTQLSNLTDWKGRQKNSSKNFVIADEDDPDYKYLQMKKESDNIFELTIQHPLSPLQAMAIAMTRFDAELK